MIRDVVPPGHWMQDIRMRSGRTRRLELAGSVAQRVAHFTPARRHGPITRVDSAAVLLQWGIGDAVMTIPFLRAIKSAFDCHITVLGKPWVGELFKGQHLVDEVLPLVPPWTAYAGKYRLNNPQNWSYLRELRRVRARQFDLAVSLR